MVRENGDSPHDEAAEKMLSPDNDKEKLAEKNVEVKFTTGESQNGDAKIDIGNIEKVKLFSWFTISTFLGFFVGC
jgi:hypothetical protein